MKITDVTVTLWEWKDIPPTRYTRTIASSESRSTQMGLVHITTDEGVDGHAFIGSALASARNTAPFIVEGLKPILIGEDPMARERIWQTAMRRARGAHRGCCSVRLSHGRGRFRNRDPLVHIARCFGIRSRRSATASVGGREGDRPERMLAAGSANSVLTGIDHASWPGHEGEFCSPVP